MPRLDQELVRQGMADSRARAQALIAAGVVRLDGQTLTKPSRTVAEGSALDITENPNPYVSRGGLKLAHGLRAFDLDPQGCHGLDLGASTGGFSEVLLAHGAVSVVSVDVGHGQLHARLKDDPRCHSLERQDVRELSADMVGRPDFLVADLAFISLTKALPRAMELAAPGAAMVALVKPQFELEPHMVGKGGIVRNAEYRAEAVASVRTFVEALGWAIIGVTDSPIEGGDGNREFLLAARKMG